ncbi:MAG: acyl-CoA thioesterase [Desulfonatronovibrio sp.]
MHKSYFPTPEGCPEPLRALSRRRVRFEEVDPLGIVWHGRYPGYFEDARMALGEKYGISYMVFHEQNVITPIRQFHADYLVPLSFGQEFTIEGIQHFSESARINIEYIIRDQTGQITTRGYTVQMLLDRDKNILIALPEFFEEFCRRWKRGQL